MKDLLQTPIEQAAVVVLDTETTGLFAATGHRIVEIGAVRFQPGPAGPWQITAELSQLLQPDRRMEPSATRVNGITDADLVGAPRFAEIAERLLELLDGALLVAHNASFDAEFLGLELHLARNDIRSGVSSMLPNPWLCTLLLARHHFYYGGNSLGHIAHVLGVRTGRSHRALNDVFVTAEVLKRMVRELAQINLVTVADLLEAQGGPLYTPAPAGVDLPAPFERALDYRQPVRIVYAGPSGTTERVIEPVYGTSKGGVTYLIAHCRLRQEQRTFRLDRVVSAQIEGR